MPFNLPYKCFIASAIQSGADSATDLCLEVSGGKLYEPGNGNEVTTSDDMSPIAVWNWVKGWLSRFDPPADTVPYWVGLVFDTRESQ